MPDFSLFFAESKGQATIYKGKTIVMMDRFPVKDGDILEATIEYTNSDYKQGFFIDVNGSCELDGEVFNDRNGIKAFFWEDTAPKLIRIKVNTESGSVCISNACEIINHLGSPSVDYWNNGEAMIVDKIKSGRRYRCNDIKPDEDFDDIIFTVKNITSPELLDSKEP